MLKVANKYLEIGVKPNFKKQGSLYIVQDDFKVSVPIIIDGHLHNARFTFGKGFACDGLSVPKIFRWFLPSWDKNKMRYNMAGVIHDALYGNKGFCVFSRDECDEIFCGLLKYSGVNGFKAEAAHTAVTKFANKHFGRDELEVANLVKMEVV